MTIEYLPDTGFIYNSEKVEWNTDRSAVRKIFGNKHKENDKIINIAQSFNDDESMNIHQKRDIYKNLNSEESLIFLNYDNGNKLIDLEVHFGYEVLICTILLEFGIEISYFVKLFEKKGFQYTELESGNYLFPELKITIADDQSMGGDGNRLTYFCGTTDVEHLSK